KESRSQKKTRERRAIFRCEKGPPSPFGNEAGSGRQAYHRDRRYGDGGGSAPAAGNDSACPGKEAREMTVAADKDIGNNRDARRYQTAGGLRSLAPVYKAQSARLTSPL